MQVCPQRSTQGPPASSLTVSTVKDAVVWNMFTTPQSPVRSPPCPAPRGGADSQPVCDLAFSRRPRQGEPARRTLRSPAPSLSNRQLDFSVSRCPIPHIGHRGPCRCTKHSAFTSRLFGDTLALPGFAGCEESGCKGLHAGPCVDVTFQGGGANI